MHKNIALLAAALLCLTHAASVAAQTYHVAKTFKLGGDGYWDYLKLDEATNRLFIGHNDRIEVVDPVRGSVIGEVPGLQRAHGIAFDPAAEARGPHEGRRGR